MAEINHFDKEFELREYFRIDTYIRQSPKELVGGVGGAGRVVAVVGYCGRDWFR